MYLAYLVSVSYLFAAGQLKSRLVSSSCGADACKGRCKMWCSWHCWHNCEKDSWQSEPTSRFYHRLLSYIHSISYSTLYIPVRLLSKVLSVYRNLFNEMPIDLDCLPESFFCALLNQDDRICPYSQEKIRQQSPIFWARVRKADKINNLINFAPYDHISRLTRFVNVCTNVGYIFLHKQASDFWHKQTSFYNTGNDKNSKKVSIKQK